jgi:hypothetical protein
LSNIYEKISGKTEPLAKIFLNKAVVMDLSWFAAKVEKSNGVHVFQATDWDPGEADVTAYGDACMNGMGYYFTHNWHGFQSVLPHAPPKTTIFYFEALTVCAIVHAATRLTPVPRRLAIYSDNTNTVNIFQSLRCKPPYNEILKSTVSAMIDYHIDLRVLHVPGDENFIADSLSRFKNLQAMSACPRLIISPFQPPRLTMGSAKK